MLVIISSCSCSTWSASSPCSAAALPQCTCPEVSPTWCGKTVWSNWNCCETEAGGQKCFQTQIRFNVSSRKQLCPSLVAIMGNPVNDKTITSHHSYVGASDRERLSERLGLGNWMSAQVCLLQEALQSKRRKWGLKTWGLSSLGLRPPGFSQEPDSVGGGVSDQGRGSGCSSSAPARIAPVVRTVCYIAAELVRLVGCVESMKPVLQSLYHRILLYPPPQHRTEAIRIMKEVGEHFPFLLTWTGKSEKVEKDVVELISDIINLVDPRQPAAPVRPRRALCGWTWNQKTVLLQEEVPPGPAETVKLWNFLLYFRCSADEVQTYLNCLWDAVVPAAGWWTGWPKPAWKEASRRVTPPFPAPARSSARWMNSPRVAASNMSRYADGRTVDDVAEPLHTQQTSEKR